MELFGATNEFVAVHLRHQEVAEEQIKRAGKRSLENLKRFLCRAGRDDAVAAGFEKEGADGENLFVVVYAEDRLLRAHAVSLLPECHLVVARGRWARQAHLLVCRRTASGCVRRLPRGPAGYGRSARDGPSAPGEQKTEESEALLSAPLGTSAICPASNAAEPRGAREARCRRRLPRGSGRRRNRSAANTVRSRCQKNWHRTHCVCRQRGCARGVATAGQSSFSQLKLSVIQAKAIIHLDNAAHCMQRRRQRFPTVRMVGEVGNGEARAKTGRY